MATRNTTAINCSLPAKKLFRFGSFSIVSKTRSLEIVSVKQNQAHDNNPVHAGCCQSVQNDRYA